MSDNPNTRPAAMSRKEAEELITKMAKDLAAAMGHGGANVNVGVQDQRLSRIINWLWLALGSIAVSAVLYAATTMQSLKESVVELNGKISVVIAQREADVHRIDGKLDDLHERLRYVEQHQNNGASK